jgi:hypothetical protein
MEAVFAGPAWAQAPTKTKAKIKGRTRDKIKIKTTAKITTKHSQETPEGCWN